MPGYRVYFMSTECLFHTCYMEKMSFHSSPLFTILVSALTSAVVVCALFFVGLRQEVGPAPLNSTSTLSAPFQALFGTDATAEEEATIRVVKNTQPAVVAILITAPLPKLQGRVPLFQFPFDPFDPFAEPPSLLVPEGQGTEKRQVGGGSGFFVSSDGMIVTNKHVVSFEGAEYSVLTADGKTYPAKLLATDPTLDLALLKIEGSGFPTLSFGDSNALVPGQTVIAIGNALDEFRNTVTKGVVSGLHRRIIAGDGVESELIEEAIQTDAAINPGNSGGPLLDLHGNVIGMNTAVSERGQSLGFALPAHLIQRDVEAFKKYGRIVRPFLGVRYQLITRDLAQRNQLKVEHGALIGRGTRPTEVAVAPGSPADKAGIVENDIILEVNGERIDEERSLASLIGRYVPGDKVTLKILHDGKENSVEVTLEEFKAN